MTDPTGTGQTDAGSAGSTGTRNHLNLLQDSGPCLLSERSVVLDPAEVVVRGEVHPDLVCGICFGYVHDLLRCCVLLRQFAHVKLCSPCSLLRRPTTGCREAHTFCYECLQGALKFQPGRCPGCRAKISSGILTRMRPLESVVDTLLLRCVNAISDGNATMERMAKVRKVLDASSDHISPAIQKEGEMWQCPFQGSTSEMLQHITNDCPFERVSCPNRLCKFHGLRRDVLQHCCSCPEETIPCENARKVYQCSDELTESQMDEELAGKEVSCDFRCKRKDMDKHAWPGAMAASSQMVSGMQGNTCRACLVKCPWQSCGKHVMAAHLEDHMNRCAETRKDGDVFAAAICNLATANKALKENFNLITQEIEILRRDKAAGLWFASQEINWCAKDILVKVVQGEHEGRRGRVIELEGPACAVALDSGVQTRRVSTGAAMVATVASQHLVPVPPQMNSPVVILRGGFKGRCGQLIGADGSDGAIHLKLASHEHALSHACVLSSLTPQLCHQTSCGLFFMLSRLHVC